MEEVLDLYQQPYDPDYPVINMDEKPVQLVEETRTPLPAQPGKPMRYDHEYERKGTASIFLFTEPLTGWRRVDAQPQRTAKKWAYQVKELLNDDYPEAQKVMLVCDNLNTHNTASLYETFEPAEARRLAKRLDIRYTPKHGSWLNIAEVELSVLTSQCLDRRIADLETMQQEIKAWEQERNTQQKGVDWRFTTEDARIRLKRLYPQYQS
jgi:hypothetical protein